MSVRSRLIRLPRRPLGGFTIFRAHDFRARLVGLAGLPYLPSGAVLELPGTRSVHTFGMRFPIDLVWLDADGRMLDADLEVPPWRVRSRRDAHGVMECPAYEGIALGSTLYGACRP